MRWLALVVSIVCTTALAVLPLVTTPNAGLAIAIGVIDVLALICVAVIDDRRAARQEVLMADLLDRLPIPTPSSAPSATLRKAALELVRELRGLLAQPGASDNASGEWAMSQAFHTAGSYARLRAIKDRLENVLGRENVVSAGRILALGHKNIKKIADHLEREALLVPTDVPPGL